MKRVGGEGEKILYFIGIFLHHPGGPGNVNVKKGGKSGKYKLKKGKEHGHGGQRHRS